MITTRKLGLNHHAAHPASSPREFRAGLKFIQERSVVNYSVYNLNVCKYERVTTVECCFWQGKMGKLDGSKSKEDFALYRGLIRPLGANPSSRNFWQSALQAFKIIDELYVCAK